MLKIKQSIFFIVFILFFVQSSFAASPEIFTSRGIIYFPKYRAQENTLDAFTGIVQWNKDHPNLQIAGSELNVVVVKPQNADDSPIFVCSHDEDLSDLTGQNVNLHNLSLQQIQALQIKQIVDKIDYGRTRSFTFFPDMLDAFMKDQPPFIIWLNVKDKSYLPSIGKYGYTSTELIKALKTWHDYYLQNRHVDIFKYIIVSSDNPFISYELSKLSESEGLDKLGLEVFPDYSYLHFPALLRKIFFALGGFDKFYNINSNWVGLDKPIITQDLINKFHKQNKKIIGWGEIGPAFPYYNQLDAVLVSY